MRETGELYKAIALVKTILESGSPDDAARAGLEEVLALLNAARATDLYNIGDHIPDGLVLFDRDGTIQYVNRANQEMFNIFWDECVGKNATEFVGDILISNATTLEVIKSRKGYSSITIPRRNGKQLLQTGVPLYAEDGEFQGALVIDQDISDIIEVKEKLNATQTQLAQTEELHKKQAQILTVLSSQNSNAGNYVYASELMKNTVRQAIQISGSDANTLITGETGSGKEVVADIIQSHSDRGDKPYIKVNCAAIPESLIESELFGYEKGAFTGALHTGKPGMFELANEGTLLLDEIGELPLSFQPKVLRALQNKQIMRIGGANPIALDVRVIASTNRDLRTMVEEGGFREDLYYRLNVLPLHVPPLRERPEDVDVLIRFFLARFNKKYKKSICIDPFAFHNMKHYKWPGNIRELENMIERWVVISEPYAVLQWKNIEHAFTDVTAFHADPGALVDSFKMRSMSDIMNEYQREVLQWAAAEYGSIRKMAEALEVDHSTIVKQAKRLGIRLFPKEEE